MKIKKLISVILTFAMVLSIVSVVPVSAEAPLDTRMEQLWYMIDSANGNGEFSFEFTQENGQTGVVEGKDGDVRVFRSDFPNTGEYQEQTNHLVNQHFGRHFRMLTHVGFNNDEQDVPTFIGEMSWSFINLSLYDGHMTFVFAGNVLYGMFNNDMWIKVSNLKNELYGVETDNFSTKTQLWWIIDSARGNGEFSFEFTQENGQTGVVEGKDGDVRVFRSDFPNTGEYQEQTNHLVNQHFGRHFRLLTQLAHNHNNEVTTGQPDTRPFPQAEHPTWLGFPETGFANGNYELFPLVSHDTLINANNPYDLNLDAGFELPRPAGDPTRKEDMFFIYEDGKMAAMFFNDMWIKVSNLKNELYGVETDNFSTKTQLWWIIDAARGNGEFSFEFVFEDGTKGVITGENGKMTVYTYNGNGTYSVTPNSPVMTVFANNFKLLTQLAHNHNNEVTTGDPLTRPFPQAEHPAWLGFPETGFANGNYELFPLVSHDTLINANNPYDLNLDAGFELPRPAGDPTRKEDMFFIYEDGKMAAMYFENIWLKISGLTKKATFNGTIGDPDDPTTDPTDEDPVKPTITSINLEATVGEELSITLEADGTKPMKWISVGECEDCPECDLPTGLSLSEDGILSGTPTTAGTFKFSVKASNIAGSDTRELTLVIQSKLGPGGVKPGFIVNNGTSDRVRIGDVLEVLKFLAGIKPNAVEASTTSWRNALITQQSLDNNRPRIGDVLEMLKHLANIKPNLIDNPITGNINIPEDEINTPDNNNE
jgi:hypothetical protein